MTVEITFDIGFIFLRARTVFVRLKVLVKYENCINYKVKLLVEH